MQEFDCTADKIPCRMSKHVLILLSSLHIITRCVEEVLKRTNKELIVLLGSSLSLLFVSSSVPRCAQCPRALAGTIARSDEPGLLLHLLNVPPK